MLRAEHFIAWDAVDAAVITDDDADMMRIMAVSVHAMLTQMRYPRTTSLLKTAGADNAPLPPWPDVMGPCIFQVDGKKALAHDQQSDRPLLRYLCSLSGVLAPCFPIGNAGCPYFRITSPQQVLETSAPVFLHAMRQKADRALSREEEAAVLARVTRRFYAMPIETFLFWREEGEALAEQYRQVQRADFGAFQRRVASVKAEPSLALFVARLRRTLDESGAPWFFHHEPPRAMRRAVEEGVYHLGKRRVEMALGGLDMPLLAPAWEALLAHARRVGEPGQGKRQAAMHAQQ